MNLSVPSKPCRYGCGKKVYWNNSLEGRIKWCEVDTGLTHNYPRCADLLKEQKKDVGVLKKK